MSGRPERAQLKFRQIYVRLKSPARVYSICKNGGMCIGNSIVQVGEIIGANATVAPTIGAANGANETKVQLFNGGHWRQ